MPDPRVVSISLAVSTTKADDTWTQAKNPAGTDINYYYLFSGGDDEHGNVDGTVHNKDIDITVSLQGASNGQYDIKNAVFKTGSNPTNVVIDATDKQKNTVMLVDHELVDDEISNYSVVVNPNNATTPDIVCDPSISNKW